MASERLAQAVAVAEEHIRWAQRWRGHDRDAANYRPALREILQSVGCDMRICGKRGRAIAVAILAAKWIEIGR